MASADTSSLGPRRPAVPDVDFSGRWQFVPDASVLQIASPDAVMFSITHREPHFHLERTLELGGHRDFFAIDLTIGAPPSTISRGDATLHARVTWDDDQLAFDTRIIRAGEEATNVVHYRLEDNGRMLIAEERFRSAKHNYDNRWVFAREWESS
jgi:hypothetical protein